MTCEDGEEDEMEGNPVGDNGDRVIERGPGPKVLMQIMIALVELAPGQTATNVTHTCPGELEFRGLFDKARVVMDQLWAQANAPRVMPASTLPRLSGPLS